MMKVPDILLQEFLVQSSMEDHNIWGMDSQYLSQLFVPKTNNTIPDFIALAEVLWSFHSKILQVVKKYIMSVRQDYFAQKTFVMIDKCSSTYCVNSISPALGPKEFVNFSLKVHCDLSVSSHL